LIPQASPFILYNYSTTGSTTATFTITALTRCLSHFLVFAALVLYIPKNLHLCATFQNCRPIVTYHLDESRRLASVKWLLSRLSFVLDATCPTYACAASLITSFWYMPPPIIPFFYSINIFNIRWYGYTRTNRFWSMVKSIFNGRSSMEVFTFPPLGLNSSSTWRFPIRIKVYRHACRKADFYYMNTIRVERRKMRDRSMSCWTRDVTWSELTRRTALLCPTENEGGNKIKDAFSIIARFSNLLLTANKFETDLHWPLSGHSVFLAKRWSMGKYVFANITGCSDAARKVP